MRVSLQESVWPFCWGGQNTVATINNEVAVRRGSIVYGFLRSWLQIFLTLTSKPASKGGDCPGWYRPAEWLISVALIPTYLERRCIKKFCKSFWKIRRSGVIIIVKNTHTQNKNIDFKLKQKSRVWRRNYYSFKIFLHFWLAEMPCIIHNQLLSSKFGSILWYVKNDVNHAANCQIIMNC